MSGSPMSRTIRSGGEAFACCTASSPSAAWATVKPCWISRALTSIRFSAASSTTRARGVMVLPGIGLPVSSARLREPAPGRTSVVLLTGLQQPDKREAIRVGDDALTYAELASAAGAVCAQVSGATRVAVAAESTLETCVAVVGALAAGVPIVPINPKSGERELEHILSDASPDLMVEVDLSATGSLPSAEPDGEAPAIVVYTSGTTGPPKGVVLPRRALATNLDALADAWQWTGDDVVAHALPLFHVHGLILGVLGPLRRGGAAWHLGKFSSQAAADALASRATMLFGVPTMYHRLAADLEGSGELARAVGQARLLVSGSAALPAADHA